MVSPFFAVYTLKNSPNFSGKRGQTKQKSTQNPTKPENLIGITVGTKLGNAVKRNRVRRRIMSIYRVHEEDFVVGHFVVIVARNRCATATYQQMEQSLLKLMGQLSLIKEGSPLYRTPPPSQKNFTKRNYNTNRNQTKKTSAPPGESP